MTKEIKVRYIPEDMFEQLHSISKKYNYPSFNEFMLSQVHNIVINDGLNLYNNKFAESLSKIKEQQAEILKLMLKNEISLSALNVKQDVLQEITMNWLKFMDDVDALEAERGNG